MRAAGVPVVPPCPYHSPTVGTLQMLAMQSLEVLGLDLCPGVLMAVITVRRTYLMSLPKGT